MRAAPDDYVAWVRWGRDDEGATWLELCDSDYPGAFKVYRHPDGPFKDFCLRLHYARIAMNNDGVRKVLDEIDSHFRASERDA